ncbi:ATP-binding protein [Nocardia sp. NPDC050710]|uniref:ATP-binding protein n=1 Tax=Nocardia sp. NPDC050710 TaxID=3157220 RepID=UPI0033DB961B
MTGTVYRENFDHLADELRRLDLMIRMRASTLRLRNREFAEEQMARAVYISEQEVDWLLATDSDTGTTAVPESLLSRLRALSEDIETGVHGSLEQGIWLALPMLGRLFGLTSLELEAVVICLAPELRRKYDRLYAYLQDDITRKRPSVDLIVELLCASEPERWRARICFTEAAPLLRAGILRQIDDPGSPSGSSGLAQFLALDPQICQFLLGTAELDPRLIDVAELNRSAPQPSPPVVDPELVDGVARLVERRLDAAGPRHKSVFYLSGPAGVGRRELARQVCDRCGIALLSVEVDAHAAESARLLRLAMRDGLLHQAAVLILGADALVHNENHALRTALSTAIADFGWLVFLIGSSEWAGGDELGGVVVQPIPLELPDITRSAAIWRYHLSGQFTDTPGWAEQLASRFHLPPARIKAAAELAENDRLRSAAPRELALADVSAACRRQSDRKLGDRAAKVRPVCGWSDLVLPPDRIGLLRDLCAQVRHQHRVYLDWGFGPKLNRGKGISALFTGPPGTGKTMAAEVIAADLDLDLYKVDLSGVVSKYIGETEKNLAHIFTEAEAGNAILFFDEADALFGKRTEVSDAHDRYANIETSYLLQRMEDYDGVVILATNFRQNMDEAFTRRLRFIVDFPFPAADSRKRIWQQLFPPRAPLAPDLDFEALARELPVAGATIRNIGLNAAFLAAADGGTIDRGHVLRGARREYEKIGKLWREADSGTPDSVGGQQC